MFTGIIERQTCIRKVSGKGTLTFVVEKPASWKLKTGGSVAINGICLTVVSHTSTSFTCDVMPETLKRTTAGAYVAGTLVNMERPLKVGDEFGGHVVLGHVDTRGKVSSIKILGASREVVITVPLRYAKHVHEKGSVTVNGASLTVARVKGNVFSIALIPHTLKVTNLGTLEKRDLVNVEFDIQERSVAALYK